MNKTLIFRKVGGIISEITEQYQYLAENPENINPLELELFIANAHFLAEHLAILKKLENTDTPSALLTEKTVPLEEFPVEEKIPAEELVPLFIHEEFNAINETEVISEVPAEIYDTEISATREPDTQPELSFQSEVIEPEVAEDMSDSVNEFLEEKPFVFETSVEETKVDQVWQEPAPLPVQESAQPVNEVRKEIRETKVVAEEKVPTLNEILAAGKTNENIAAKISRIEDKDLRSMINLNDKLMFVRDLFNGYSLAYSEAIDLVNRFDNFKAAENFLLQNYAAKNKWSEKQQTVDQFYEVLNKRFS